MTTPNYDEILSKYQMSHEGAPVELLDNPTIRYVRVKDGKVRNLDFDPATDDPEIKWLDTVAAETVEHDLGEEISIARGFGWTFPDLDGETCVVQLSQADETYVNHGWLLGGKNFMTERGQVSVVQARK